MTSREDFDELFIAVKILDAILRTQEKKRIELFDKIGKVYKKVIVDENTLATVIWTNTYKGLEPARDQDNAAAKVAKLIEASGGNYRGYHWSFKIEDGVLFKSDDFRISICFNNENIIPGFIKRHNLTVDTAELDAQIVQTKSQLENLIETKAIFDARRNEETAVPEEKAGS